MPSKVINYQRLCKAIGKHIGVAYPLNFEFDVAHYFLDIIVLNIDVLGINLAFSIFGQDDACFIISI